jgi:hypothetical protein
MITVIQWCHVRSFPDMGFCIYPSGLPAISSHKWSADRSVKFIVYQRPEPPGCSSARTRGGGYVPRPEPHGDPM